MATTMNKNKVSDMAKDFGLTSKDILSVLSTYEDGSKKPSQVLSADEVNLIFEHLTQKHQVKIESIYAESAPQKKPEPKAAPAPAQRLQPRRCQAAGRSAAHAHQCDLHKSSLHRCKIVSVVSPSSSGRRSTMSCTPHRAAASAFSAKPPAAPPSFVTI